MESITACLLILVLSNIIAFSTTSPVDKACSANEIFKDAGYDCQTCLTITKDCDKETKESKCYCKGGYIREYEGGNCILYEECVRVREPRCRVNETFGLYFNCASCSNYPLVFCAPVNEPQCVCFPGYVHHDDTNLCIATQDCPNKFNFPSPCLENETYSQTGYDCLTCQDVAAGILKKCAENKLEQCYCNSGYLRDTISGRCRPYEECKNKNKVKDDDQQMTILA